MKCSQVCLLWRQSQWQRIPIPAASSEHWWVHRRPCFDVGWLGSTQIALALVRPRFAQWFAARSILRLELSSYSWCWRFWVFQCDSWDVRHVRLLSFYVCRPQLVFMRIWVWSWPVAGAFRCWFQSWHFAHQFFQFPWFYLAANFLPLFCERLGGRFAFLSFEPIDESEKRTT